MPVWLNGQLVPLDDARVSAFDAGFQHGVGLFETMLARAGRIVRVEAHLERLRRSAVELRLVETLRLEPLREAIELTLSRNRLSDARIRLTLSGGDLNMLVAARAGRTADSGGAQNSGGGTRSTVANTPTVLIHAQPPVNYPEAFFEKGVAVTVANARLNPLDPFAGHKTLHYWPRLRALQDAAAVGAGEAIWFTVSNHLAGGSVSNIFLVKSGSLLTPIARGEEDDIDRDAEAAPDAPSLPSPVLPGVTRGAILAFAHDQRHHVERRMLDINDLLGADEAFLTNASWGVLPVVQVERERIGDGTVGPMTRGLRSQWLGT
jgi:branched-chain amino acid aminotransferase